MAVFGSKETQRSNRSSDRDERPQAQVWVNIGKTLPVEQPDGTMKPTFISLPVGIPLDTTEPMPVRGNSKAWANQVAVKNAILKFLQEVGTGLEAGEGELIEGLEIQVYRRNTAQSEPSADENPLMAALAAAGLKVA